MIKARSVIIPVMLVLLIGFVFYLMRLYGQLKTEFTREEQLIPTRIYSDVTRLAPPETRSLIEDKLKNLGYKATITADEIRFRLHTIDYPDYLIPDTHPQLDAGQPESNREVLLHFGGGSRKDDLLQSIEYEGHEVPDLYLEPEIVAALSHGTVKDGKKVMRQVLHWDNPDTHQSDFPPLVWKAIIAVEDPRFMEHSGLDPRGLARAVWVDLRTRSLSQGGSTITLQLVKNLLERHNKNVFRKINELFLALMLEATYKKEQILERYLNEVYLGNVGSIEVHGVAEGAEHFFGKRDLHDLNLAEIALMAGLIRGTAYYSPYKHWDRAIQRQRFVLKKMVENGQIAEEEADEAMKMPIRLAPPTTVSNKSPYFTDFVKNELLRQLKAKEGKNEDDIVDSGYRVYTTLDLSMNMEAQDSVARGIERLEKQLRYTDQDKTENRLEGAIAVVDHNTGYIRALVGGRSYAQLTFNRILNMKRQVGSTFKPVVYLSAILKGQDEHGVPYGPSHPIEDSPWTLIYDHGRQRWTPKNYEKEYLGWIDYRKALAHSINTSAARLGYEVGLNNIVLTARKLGIVSELPQVPSLTLGVAELSPIELLHAYSIFANHGVENELTVIRSITKEDGSLYLRFVSHPNKIFDPGPIDLLTDMLQSVFKEGTAIAASAMGFDRDAAGKTGTTSHHRDAWFAGYTPELTTVAWVGMDQPHDSAKVKLSGPGSALPIWVDFMKHALAGLPPTPFPLSPEVAENVRVDIHTGMGAIFDCPDSQTISAKFVRGDEPKASTCAPAYPESVHEQQAD